MGNTFRVTRFLVAGACAGLLAACTTHAAGAWCRRTSSAGSWPRRARTDPRQEGRSPCATSTRLPKWSQYTKIMIRR